MLLKEIISIKPGSFIKGIRFLDNMFPTIPHGGRRVTFLLNGWNIPLDLKDKDYAIRTPWFNCPDVKYYNSIEINDLLVGEKYKQLSEDFQSFECFCWAEFKINEPIGIHLGQYGLSIDSYGNILFYTKILRNDGKVGFLALTTKNLEENELELL